MERRQGLEGQEVVGVGRPVRLAPGRIEHVHRLPQADIGADGPHGGRVELRQAAATASMESA